MISPPRPDGEGGVPEATASVAIVVSCAVSVRYTMFELMDGSAVLLLCRALDDAVSIAVGVESRVEVSMSTVEDTVDVALELGLVELVIAEVGVDVVVPLSLCAAFQGARRHCCISVLSTRWPFWVDGVRLRT